MPSPNDVVDAMEPALSVGERVSLRVPAGGAAREVIGFVTALSVDRLGVVDRRGVEHDLARSDVDAIRRVDVALGRRPEATPRDLLDALAERAGVEGACWVGRISTLLAGRTPPASVPPWGEWADVDGVRARFEGEWVTLPTASEAAVVAAAWWATRMGARSVQVRTDDPACAAALGRLGFSRLG